MNITEEYVKKLEKAAIILKAIAHPMRISIVNFLTQNEKLSVKELHQLLDIEQSTTSHHLGILKDKGVLTAERNGRNIYYSLVDKSLITLIHAIKECTGC